MKVERLQPLWFSAVANSGNNEKEEPFMGSVLRAVGRGKRKQLDRTVEGVNREEYEGMPLDSRVALIRTWYRSR